MLIQPMYFAVFYDVKFPKDVLHAMSKRIDLNKFTNLTDGIISKFVELDSIVDEQVKKETYKVLNFSTFNINNSVDNHYLVICDVEKIK